MQGKVTNLAKHTFSECGHVAYQIKGNEMYNNIQANILTLCTSSSPGVGSKQLLSSCEPKTQGELL